MMPSAIWLRQEFPVQRNKTRFMGILFDEKGFRLKAVSFGSEWLKRTPISLYPDFEIYSS
jgi:hypothetical protein